MYRKMGLVALLIALVFALVACGQGETNSKGEAGKEEANKQPVKIRIGNIYDQNTTFGKALEKFKQDVEKNSNGEIQVEIFHNGTLGSEKDHIEALKAGSLEMMETGTAGISLYVPETAIFELWYMYEDMGQLVRAFEGLMPELDKMYQEKGFKLLGAYYDGPRNILSKAKIEKLEDLQGLKLRVPGSTLYMNMANALGAKAVSMPLNDVYTGLETGAIDAMEGSPDAVFQQKFFEKAKYYIDDRHVYQPLSLIINNEFWNKLSDEHKKIISEMAKKSSEYQLSLVEKTNSETLENLKSQGVEIVTLKDPEKWREAVHQASIDFAKQYGEKGEMILNKINEYIKEK